MFLSCFDGDPLILFFRLSAGILQVVTFGHFTTWFYLKVETCFLRRCTMNTVIVINNTRIVGFRSVLQLIRPIHLPMLADMATDMASGESVPTSGRNRTVLSAEGIRPRGEPD